MLPVDNTLQICQTVGYLAFKYIFGFYHKYLSLPPCVCRQAEDCCFALLLHKALRRSRRMTRFELATFGSTDQCSTLKLQSLCQTFDIRCNYKNKKYWLFVYPCSLITKRIIYIIIHGTDNGGSPTPKKRDMFLHNFLALDAFSYSVYTLSCSAMQFQLQLIHQRCGV